MLSHASILGHLRRYAATIEVRPSDCIVSWLPLYHDMGLIAAFHLALSTGIPLVQLDPFEWVQVPAMLLKAISRYRATLCWLPNFAYTFLADRVRDDDLEDVRLESLRLMVNCSERVREQSHERVAARFAACGLRPSALGASYAMAETTFALTQTPPGAPARVVHVERDALSRGYVVAHAEPSSRTTPCVSSGRVLEGCEVMVTDDAGEELADGRLGHLLARSESMFDGYRNHPDKTRAAFRNGWYITGDLGFRMDGELFVLGRSKDVIIHAGKNVYPEDVEAAIAGVNGVIPGRSVAVGVENASSGTEEIWVVAEREPSDERSEHAIRRDILRSTIQADVTVSRVVLVPPRWLFKSSSGKLCRHTNRDRAVAYVSGREP